MSQPQVYSKRDVDYRKGELPEVCKNCIHFIQGIKEGDVCNLWSPNEETEEED